MKNFTVLLFALSLSVACEKSPPEPREIDTDQIIANMNDDIDDIGAEARGEMTRAEVQRRFRARHANDPKVRR